MPLVLTKLTQRRRYSGVLYRGINKDLNPIMRQKYESYETEFKTGSIITFPAPTSCTTSDVIAGEFTNGIQLVIQKASGVKLVPGHLSAYDEDEVMPAFPSSYVVIARSKVQQTVVVVIEAISTAIIYCSAPDAMSLDGSVDGAAVAISPKDSLFLSRQDSNIGSLFKMDSAPKDTFFEQELIYKQNKDSPKIRQYFMSFFMDRSSRNCILKFQKIKGGMKGLFLTATPSKRHSGEYFIVAPGSSFQVAKSSLFNFCIAISIPKTGDQPQASIIIGYDDSASLEKTQICFQMGLNRSTRMSGGVGRYADADLLWDRPVSHDDMFKSTYTATAKEFCMRYGCLCSMESRKAAAKSGFDSYLLCVSIKIDLENILREWAVKSESGVQITKSSSSSITIHGPYINWHLDRVWHEARCKSARVIQQKWREQRLIHKVLALRDGSLDAMEVKPRRVSSYLRPFRTTHIDDRTASQLQHLLNLHCGWLGFGQVRECLKVLFAAPLESVVAPSNVASNFEWLTGHYLVIVPEFVVILGQQLPDVDANVRKFSFRDCTPELFVRQVIPISQIHEAILSTYADDAMVRLFYVFMIHLPNIC